MYLENHSYLTSIMHTLPFLIKFKLPFLFKYANIVILNQIQIIICIHTFQFKSNIQINYLQNKLTNKAKYYACIVILYKQSTNNLLTFKFL
jgi:hypothetical protein